MFVKQKQINKPDEVEWDSRIAWVSDPSATEPVRLRSECVHELKRQHGIHSAPLLRSCYSQTGVKYAQIPWALPFVSWTVGMWFIRYHDDLSNDFHFSRKKNWKIKRLDWFTGCISQTDKKFVPDSIVLRPREDLFLSSSAVSTARSQVIHRAAEINRNVTIMRWICVTWYRTKNLDVHSQTLERLTE